MKGSSKKVKVLLDMNNSVVTAGGLGDVKGMNGNRKSTIKKRNF